MNFFFSFLRTDSHTRFSILRFSSLQSTRLNWLANLYSNCINLFIRDLLSLSRELPPPPQTQNGKESNSAHTFSEFEECGINLIGWGAAQALPLGRWQLEASLLKRSIASSFRCTNPLFPAQCLFANGWGGALALVYLLSSSSRTQD